MKKQTMTNIATKQEQAFRCPDCRFAGGKICGECGHRDPSDGYCRRHGGSPVDYDKWACSDFV